jgi:hypothetical protein
MLGIFKQVGSGKMRFSEENVDLSGPVSDSMGPLGHRMLRKQKSLALPRYLVTY